jgi:dTDP-4-amino-4,6-dideoxygalactose transaminase
VGYNLRLTEFQAAILRAQLVRHPAQQEVREANARLLSELLGESSEVVLAPADDSVTGHGRHLFMLRLPNLGAAGKRDAAVRALGAEGLGASSGYVPLHRNEALVSEAKAIADRLSQPWPEPNCPQADLVSTDTIWLPQPYLLGTEEQTRGVAAAILKVVSNADQLD